jgi:hypothetical protein
MLFARIKDKKGFEMNNELIQKMFIWIDIIKEDYQNCQDWHKDWNKGRLSAMNQALTSICETCYCTNEQLTMSNKRFNEQINHKYVRSQV